MEKDVLLEYVSFGYLVKDETPETIEDLKAMGLLWNRIMYTKCEQIDYEATLEEIRKLRKKYEK